MYNENYLPETYEEYGRLNGFGETEMNDEYAPYAKMFYEKMAKLINQIAPFTEEEIQVLKEREGVDIIAAAFELGHISAEVYEEIIATFNEMEEYSDEVFAAFGFIYDLYAELFYILT